MCVVTGWEWVELSLRINAQTFSTYLSANQLINQLLSYRHTFTHSHLYKQRSTSERKERKEITPIKNRGKRMSSVKRKAPVSNHDEDPSDSEPDWGASFYDATPPTQRAKRTKRDKTNSHLLAVCYEKEFQHPTRQVSTYFQRNPDIPLEHVFIGTRPLLMCDKAVVRSYTDFASTSKRNPMFSFRPDNGHPQYKASDNKVFSLVFALPRQTTTTSASSRSDQTEPLGVPVSKPLVPLAPQAPQAPQVPQASLCCSMQSLMQHFGVATFQYDLYLAKHELENVVFPNVPVVLCEGEAPDHTEILVSAFEGHMYVLVAKIPKSLLCQGMLQKLETGMTQTQVTAGNNVCELVPRPGRCYRCDKTGPDVLSEMGGITSSLRYGMRLVTKAIGTGFPPDVAIHVDLPLQAFP